MTRPGTGAAEVMARPGGGGRLAWWIWSLAVAFVVYDVMKPSQTGTSAAIVNGVTFLVGGILISRPGVRIGWGTETGIEPKTLALAQYASWPLLGALAIALALAFFLKETYPKS